DWMGALTDFKPDLLFCESAWRGNNGRWLGSMTEVGSDGHRSLAEMVAWCRERDIPTVFWNKEDPPNFEVFVETAALFDWVFTVDEDRAAVYQARLGHDRIKVLPFAAQPRIHNPVAIPGGRSQAVAFAGTYFGEKHPARAIQMQTIVEPAIEFGLHI